jgi:CheY-like chemotaxis protein
MSEGILVVDDDPITRRVLLALFGTGGERVICAASGPEALAILETFRPRIACIDLNMPAMSGLELVEAMRTRHGDTMPAVVMLTASGDPADASRAATSGIDRYLTKPVGSMDVADILAVASQHGAAS